MQYCHARRAPKPSAGAIKILMGAIALTITAFSFDSQAAFNCGTGWTAYARTDGVRCVLSVPAQGTRPEGYVFYGEGKHGSQKYRHIGALRRVGTSSTFTGSVVDINGNGEAFSDYSDGTFSISRSSVNELYPPSFSVPAWFETWTRVGGGQTSNPSYTTELSRPRVCGSRFIDAPHAKLRQFRAFSYNGSYTESLSGITCALTLDGGLGPHQFDVALGSGAVLTRSSVGTSSNPVPWQEARYMHVVARQATSYGMWDLCNLGNPSLPCTSRPFGQANVTQETLADTGNGVGLLAGTFIRTLWIPFKARYAIRVLALDASDINGSRRSGITANDLNLYVQQANVALNVPGSPRSFQYLYNRTYPGTAGDLSPVANDDLNNQDLNIPENGTDQALMDWYAELAPHRAVSIFVYGPYGQTGPCRQTGGTATTWRKFAMIMSPLFGDDKCEYRPCGIPNESQVHFVHEQGHFFGLGHTHQGDGFADQTAASTAWACNNNNIDGDRLDLTVNDTSPDPLITGVNGVGGRACDRQGTVTLSFPGCSAATFTPPRENIMSFHISQNFPNDKTVTSGQRMRMEAVLTGTATNVSSAIRQHRARLY